MDACLHYTSRTDPACKWFNVHCLRIIFPSLRNPQNITVFEGVWNLLVFYLIHNILKKTTQTQILSFQLGYMFSHLNNALLDSSCLHFNTDKPAYKIQINSGFSNISLSERNDRWPKQVSFKFGSHCMI